MKWPTLIIVLLILIGCSQETPRTDSDPAVSSVSQLNERITTGTLQTRLVDNTIECTGRIEIPPSDMYSIHSRADGYVRKLTKLPGDRVRKGEIIAEIENPDFIGMQREAYELRHQFATAESQFKRQKLLADKNATTARQYDEAYGNYNVTKASYFGLLRELEAIGIMVDTASESPDYQNALTIHSPVSGHITSVNTNMGKYVESHDELLTIANRDHMHLELFILEKDINSVAVGQEVLFRSSNSPAEYKAEIVKINSVTDRETGTIMAHCHITTPGVTLKGGTFARAKVATGAVEVTGLPVDALIREGDRWYGYLEMDGGYSKVELSNVHVNQNFASFDVPAEYAKDTWVTAGAYYIE